MSSNIKVGGEELPVVAKLEGMHRMSSLRGLVHSRTLEVKRHYKGFLSL